MPVSYKPPTYETVSKHLLPELENLEQIILDFRNKGVPKDIAEASRRAKHFATEVLNSKALLEACKLPQLNEGSSTPIKSPEALKNAITALDQTTFANVSKKASDNGEQPLLEPIRRVAQEANELVEDCRTRGLDSDIQQYFKLHKRGRELSYLGIGLCATSAALVVFSMGTPLLIGSIFLAASLDTLYANKLFRETDRIIHDLRGYRRPYKTLSDWSINPAARINNDHDINGRNVA